ncbi:MAG: type II toxin-antitoxin system RelE/ParE family toxin [Chloroflexota bacterium]|nr:type II toxin-antitoxin system RelE/ParE family toxin [Chloroflexota bacterium]
MVEPYEVEFRPGAHDGLRRLDHSAAERVLKKIKWLASNYETVPQESLTGEFKGLFKLRIGDYRVIYSSSRAERLLTIHLIEHRREIYERR